MAAPKKCILIFHGMTKEINMGEFDSKAAARRYVSSYGWSRPFTIKPLGDE